MLTPFASLTAAAAHFEGWTETGGPFPASFDDIDDTLFVGRLGIHVSYEMNDNTLVFASLAWAHRSGDTTTGMSGTLTGLSDFHLGGASVAENWAEVTAGASFALPQDFTATASLTSSFYPGETLFQVRFGLSHPF
jgi:outer membrane autotransporter protein